jgi:hypothetical protein
VVTADSRTTVAGEYFDGRVKLYPIDTAPALVFTITGHSDFIPLPPPGTTMREWFPRAPYRFRGRDVVEAALRAAPSSLVTVATVGVVATRLASALDGYFAGWPAARGSFIDRDVCRLAVFQVHGDVMLAGSVLVRMTTSGGVVADGPALKTYTKDSPKDFYLVGEDTYAMTHVLRTGGGVGSQFFPDRAATIFNKAQRVKDITASDGAFLAQAIIQATSATTALVPVPSGNGIGGPVHGYVVSPTAISPLFVNEK